MEEETQTKPKLSRVELLAKARQAKAEKARLKKEQQGTAEYEFVGSETQNPVVVDAKKEKKPKKEKKQKPTIEESVFDMSSIYSQLEPEIVEEVVRVPGNKKKKIVKRTIEIEDSETEEEIQEEIVKVPKMKKELKINRSEMKAKLVEANSKRLLNELFS